MIFNSLGSTYRERAILFASLDWRPKLDFLTFFGMFESQLIINCSAPRDVMKKLQQFGSSIVFDRHFHRINSHFHGRLRRRCSFPENCSLFSRNIGFSHVPRRFSINLCFNFTKFFNHFIFVAFSFFISFHGWKFSLRSLAIGNFPVNSASISRDFYDHFFSDELIFVIFTEYQAFDITFQFFFFCLFCLFLFWFSGTLKMIVTQPFDGINQIHKGTNSNKWTRDTCTNLYRGLRGTHAQIVRGHMHNYILFGVGRKMALKVERGCNQTCHLFQNLPALEHRKTQKNYSDKRTYSDKGTYLDKETYSANGTKTCVRTSGHFRKWE